jgi:hypothetical protein
MTIEADTCRKYVVPKLYSAGWMDEFISEQVTYTDGRIRVSGGQPHQLRPMLLRLWEALGGNEARLLEAKAAVLAAGSNEANRAAALRRVLPWAELETLLEAATRVALGRA